MKVGFIGLGRMGLPMSHRLLQAGFELTVHNRSQGKVQEMAKANRQGTIGLEILHTGVEAIHP